MAHRATVFSPNDVARLRKLATGLIEFVAKLDGGSAKPAVLAPPAKRRKPTGAAAHKSYLAKQAGGKGKGKTGKPPDYPPVLLDEQQQATLATQPA